MTARVEASTGALFHDPSLGTASRVLPKFHPGFNAANAADAVTGVKAAVHDCTAVGVAIVEVFEVETIVLVCVLSVVAVEDRTEVLGVAIGPAPGMH